MLQRPAAFCAALSFCAISAFADRDNNNNNGCSALPGQAQLKSALASATNDEGSGLNMNMWATIVDRDGIVCAVAFTGTNRGSQWPGSRVISAQKANTANAFSLDGTAVSGGNGSALALSTANLFSAVQPGGSLFGLQESSPVDTSVAYAGPSSLYGTAADPMAGSKIGGINVFGGGLALYDTNRHIVGAVGVSGDTSCADHNIAWRTRNNLNLDHMGNPTVAIQGPASLFASDPKHPDNIIYDIMANPAGGTGISPSTFGHPTCFNQTTDPKSLPPVRN
jgi:uncharacterized protein GlcG (DUF336 family)